MDIHTIPRLNRAKAILITLIKYGFGDIVDRLELRNKLVPFKIRSHEYSHKTTWERLILVLTELGPTFVKFGQILSLRPDLIPRPLLNELSKLQDDVPPEPFSKIKAQVEDSLGTDLEEIFLEFQKEPLAAASLAQVHRAVLTDSQKTVVAVKVQRPGIKRTIKNDLNILATLAKQVHERIDFLRVYNFPLLVQELRKLLLSELDFEKEAKNIRLAQNNFYRVPELYLPQTFKKYSTSQVLVMELIQGTKLKNALELPQKEKIKIAKTGINFTLKQILEDGFFHADPHPGNIFILPDGKISFLDWGMVGRITPNTKLQLLNLFDGIINKDSETVLKVFFSFSEVQDYIDKNKLQLELIDILDDYHSVPVQEINMGKLLSALTNILHEHRITVKPEIALLIKSIVTSEGSARYIHPELNIVSEAEPYIKKLVLQTYSPLYLFRQLRLNIGNLLQFQKELPEHLSGIQDQIKKGNLSVRFEHKGLEPLRHTLDHIANRLTLGIITAAMIIGSSMIITTGIDPLLFGYPALGLIGYLLSAFVGGWLAVDIIKKKKDVNRF